MKKSKLLLLPLAALMAGFASCSPDDTPTPDPTPTPTTPSAPTPPSPTIGGTYGGLVAVQMEFSYSQMGFDVDVPTEIGVGAFYTDATNSTMVDAGTVKLNNIELDKNANLSYSKVATTGMTPDDLDIDNGVAWSVSGGNGIPAINYTHTGAFPDYTGTIPTSVTRADGMSLTLSSGTVTNADSVYVFIVSGSGNLLKSYAANAGPITISGTELNTLAASSTTNPAYIEVIPWKYTVQAYGTKTVAFIKEKAIVKSLTLN